MINDERIVSVTKTDLLSLYGMILKQNKDNAELEVAKSGDVLGNFVIKDATNPLIADQPVVTCDFAEGVTTATIYFVADPHYIGFSVAGAVVESTGDTVEAKNETLYMAELASGAVTITKMGI